MSRAPTIGVGEPPFPARGRGRFRDSSGFTLVEVSLALLLIAVLAALSLPGLVRATGPSSLRIAALQVAALLREDRNAALTTGRLVISSVVPHAVRAGASQATLVLPQGAKAEVLGASLPGIRFFADGRSSGGTIVLASATSHILVAVSPDTGAIHVAVP